MHFGLDALHREVGTLHEPDPDWCATTVLAGGSKFEELVEGTMGIGKVGLKCYPRAEVDEFLLGEDAAEKLEGEVEVAMLLHVEVHELGWARRGCEAIET